MNTDASPPKKQNNPLLTIAGLLAGVVGYYCGLMILIPLGSAIIVMLLAKRLAPAAPYKPFSAALAVIFGHLVWMMIGVIGLHTVAPLIFDLVIIIAGLLWLLLWPGLMPVIFLGIYEIAGLVVNVIAILHQDFGTTGHKALTAHIALRLFAIGALVMGYIKFRKNENWANPASNQPPAAGADVQQ